MNKELTMEAIAVIDSLLHQIGQMSGMFDDEDGTIEEAVDAAVEVQAKLRAAPDNAEAVAILRIRSRLAGEWFDPTGDLESDIAKVLRELDGTAEADEPEDSDDNPFDPESPEGRAWDRGEMNVDGSLKKSFRVIIAWNDRDPEEGTYSDEVEATDVEEAEQIVREMMASDDIYKRKDFRYGRLIECAEVAG